MSYQVLARKFRPQTFDEVIGQGHITQTLRHTVESKRVAQGYLFSGMRGVGKTTMARILAKALNCETGPTPTPCNGCVNCEEITQGSSVDVLEIDGASNTSVDDIRELRENVLYAPARNRYKIYIIDEVHMLSKNAFNALLKTLEEPPPHVIFVFATTEPQKVPITIKSRCQCFHFRRISLQKVSEKLLQISEQEGFSLDLDSARLIGQASEGSMRDAQSLLDQVLSFTGGNITVEETKQVLGVIDHEVLEEATGALIEQDAERALNVVEKLHVLGVDLVEFCKELQSHLRNLLMSKILKDPAAVTTLSQEEMQALKPLASAIDEDRLMGLIEHLSRSEEEIRRTTHPRILLEISIVKMTRIKPLRDFQEILAHLETMERKFNSGNLMGNANPSTHKAINSPPQDGTTVDESRAEQSAPESRNASFSIHWEDLVKHANNINPPVGSLFEHGFLEKADQNSMIIGFKKKIHYEMAIDKKEKIGEILKNYYQRAMKPVFTFQNGSVATPKTLTEKRKEKVQKKNDKLKEENMKNHVVQDALRIFKGKVLEVREYGTEPKGRP